MPSNRSLVSIAATIILAAMAAWLNVSEKPTIQTSNQTDCGSASDKCRSADRPKAVPSGRRFDYYVLSLSWSPTWCLSNSGEKASEQCDRDADFGYVVHGLWPSSTTKDLAFCPTRLSDRVPDNLGRSMLDIMPSMGLVGHQWRKHGTCSGLTQDDYFKVVREARNRVSLPAAIRPEQGDPSIGARDIAADLIAANPGLTRAGLQITCEGNRLDEIRFCLTSDLDFRACPQSMQRGCNKDNLTIPPVP